jgi:hypothetical protein
MEGADVFVFEKVNRLGGGEDFDLPAAMPHKSEAYPVSQLLHHGEVLQSLIGGVLQPPVVLLAVEVFQNPACPVVSMPRVCMRWKIQLAA